MIAGLDPLLASLVLAALLVGATGTWSPCGFSMIETIGPTGHTGGLRTTLAACATFAPFAVLGAIATFVALAWLGSVLHGAGDTIAYVLAAVIALAAAVAEARGLRIVPQVRRQLPIGWRSSAPMPVAAAGYGILLGLGFTTFILSYGVWALMGVSLAIGEPTVGVALGLGFGLGRALPIVVLAPLADRPSGERACEAMAMRSGLYRGARLADAAALGLVALALAGNAQAQGSKQGIPAAFDPSASGPLLAYERANGEAILRRGDGSEERLPGTDPAVGGSRVAVVKADGITLLDRKDLRPVTQIPAGAADAVAVSSRWLAWRARRGQQDVLLAVSIANPANPGPIRQVASARTPSQLGRPSLSGGTVAYAVAKQRKNHLVLARLGAKKGIERRTVRSSRLEALSNPAIRGSEIAFVQTTADLQRVRVAGLGAGDGQTVYRRPTGRGTLWSLALDGERLYVTVIKRNGATSIVTVER